MAVLDQVEKKDKYGHIQVKTVNCPVCGYELRYTDRTTALSCACGKHFRLVHPPVQPIYSYC